MAESAKQAAGEEGLGRSRRFADGAAEMRAWPSKPNDAVGAPILTTQRASCRPRRITSD